MFVPKINLPSEGVEHARWLEKRSIAQEKEIAALRRSVDLLLASNAALARPTPPPRAGGAGVPLPAPTGMVLRGTGTSPSWTYEWQGLMPEYWVSLDPAGGSYYVTGLTGTTEADEAAAQLLLPPVGFDDGGQTMLPIFLANYADGPDFAGGQAPIHLYVSVNPASEGQEFTIHLPRFDQTTGVVAPIYTFQLDNIGEYGAVVNIQDTNLIYEGTLTPVLGDTDTWSVAAGFQAAWSVRNVKGWGATATPSVYWDGSSAVFSDEYYQTNVYVP